MGWISDDTVTPTEILASDHYVARAITIASGAGSIVKGRVLGQYNTGVNSGCFAKYDDTQSNGLEVAAGIAVDKYDATSSGAQGAMYTHASVYEENLTGLDANAKTDLKGITFVHKA